MGRTPCCENVGLKRGRWSIEEDEVLVQYIKVNGEGCWRSVPRNAGLRRCGKSCRLRWINYLRPDLKRGNITPQEEEVIISLQASMGNRWSLIAKHLPGRTDNEIKNYWNSHLIRKLHSFITNKTVATDATARGDRGHRGYKKSRTRMHKTFLKPVAKSKSMQSITEQETTQEELISIDSVKVTKLSSEALSSNEESVGSVMFCPEPHDNWEGLEHELTNGVSGGWRCVSVGNGKDFHTGAPAPVNDEWVDWHCVDNQKKLGNDNDETLSWLWDDEI